MRLSDLSRRTQLVSCRGRTRAQALMAALVITAVPTRQKRVISER